MKLNAFLLTYFRIEDDSPDREHSWFSSSGDIVDRTQFK